VLTTLAEWLDTGHADGTFLCPTRGNDAIDGHARITMLACSRQPPYYLAAVVARSPPGNLRGLTRLELEILGLLIDDWSDAQIADALGLPCHYWRRVSSESLPSSMRRHVAWRPSEHSA
jgi:hypothetical protein